MHSIFCSGANYSHILPYCNLHLFHLAFRFLLFASLFSVPASDPTCHVNSCGYISLGSWPWVTCQYWFSQSSASTHNHSIGWEVLSLLVHYHWATLWLYQILWPPCKGNESGKVHYFSQVCSVCEPIATFMFLIYIC